MTEEEATRRRDERHIASAIGLSLRPCVCGHPFGLHDFEECVGRVCRKCPCLDWREPKRKP